VSSIQVDEQHYLQVLRDLRHLGEERDAMESRAVAAERDWQQAEAERARERAARERLEKALPEIFRAVAVQALSSRNVALHSQGESVLLAKLEGERAVAALAAEPEAARLEDQEGWDSLSRTTKAMRDADYNRHTEACNVKRYKAIGGMGCNCAPEAARDAGEG
jgi:hypothetical protein